MRATHRNLSTQDLPPQPFFQTPEFRMSVYRNTHPGEKDFGVLPERLNRARVKL